MFHRRHLRFYAAFACGMVAFAAAGTVGTELRFLLAGNVFFATYLLLTAGYIARATAAHLKQAAAGADEGLPLILLVTGGAVLVSVGAIFLLLGEKAAPGPFALGLALAGVPLGWLTLHTVAAFHYANLYYRQDADVDGPALDFPATPEPDFWDFLYYSLVVGMTAQVSDVAVRSARMRRATLAHGVVSFFYNTVILALAINAAASYAG